MPQFATAHAATPTAPSRSSLSDALALVVQAGSTIVDLRARLAEAERTIARLDEEKRVAQAELRAIRHGDMPAADAPAETPSNRSHLDDALAAVVEGLGPTMVRVGH